ncbi:uncharacterized protein LAESUDRAFT_652261 [Laetiporus sulphureus 93-53]|uniref:mRNA export factor GLE1 n=1 Tax=Laetiporus sulphureus 93-53 TaxID=1314785 RepID=A0A165EFS9_9APHY|nr:uncharacterized protein LAESUDRAFT_652261 [Laetiporus sulphureus 93-53]KZT06969.1 hypothetical protein LAESUDRAFT_652261 [Laetiporus sulphureus 93-53]
MHYIEDALASIRLRAKHHDPYEEWEANTKREAFRTARAEQAFRRQQRQELLARSHADALKQRNEKYQKELKAVQTVLSAQQGSRRVEGRKLLDDWESRSKSLLQHIESVIKAEEERAKAQQEIDRKKKEEEEKRRREEEERRREEEGRRRQEEENRRKEEEERKRKEQEEAQAKQKREQEEKVAREQEQAEQQQRATLGYTTPLEDWKRARSVLKNLKTGPMAIVKGDKALKAMWGTGRRAITPRVGQLTADEESVSRITGQLIDILHPKQPHPEHVYYALLSSLAKAILLQAETEVTAEKHSARPLADVTVRLLSTLNGFVEIFWAKLCQRAGGWPVPVMVPEEDVDGTKFDAAAWRKACGYRDGENSSDYTTRVSGLMRLYFMMLGIRSSGPLDFIFSTSKFWTYCARMLSEPSLLKQPIAPSILFVALDVAGQRAGMIWGPQWVKLLSLLYEGVTVGVDNSRDSLIGGADAEAVAARMRIQLQIEKVMKAL